MPRGKRAESNDLEAAKAKAAERTAEAEAQEAVVEEGGDEESPGLGHNVREYTPDERFALLSQHKQSLVRLRTAKKKASDDVKTGEKLAKAELGDEAVDEINEMIQLETVEGEAKFKADVERRVRVARWMGLPVGTNGSLFDEIDRTPGVDRAAANGKRAGLAGESCEPPHDPSTPQFTAWTTGWQEGQRILFNIKPLEPVASDSSAEFDDLPPAPDANEPQEGARA